MVHAAAFGMAVFLCQAVGRGAVRGPAGQRAAAQKYGARGVGVELDPRLLAISREVAREGEVAHRVAFIEGDLFATDISEATVVTLYLSTGVNRRLEPKLRRELKPGTRIVSHQFRIGRWTPDEAIRADDGTELFLWTIPGR